MPLLCLYRIYTNPRTNPIYINNESKQVLSLNMTHKNNKSGFPLQIRPALNSRYPSSMVQRRKLAKTIEKVQQCSTLRRSQQTSNTGWESAEPDKSVSPKLRVKSRFPLPPEGIVNSQLTARGVSDDTTRSCPFSPVLSPSHLCRSRWEPRLRGPAVRGYVRTLKLWTLNSAIRPELRDRRVEGRVTATSFA